MLKSSDDVDGGAAAAIWRHITWPSGETVATVVSWTRAATSSDYNDERKREGGGMVRTIKRMQANEKRRRQGDEEADNLFAFRFSLALLNFK